MEAFKIKPFVRSGDPVIDRYLQEMEQFILNLEASNIKRMIVAIDNVAAGVADDLNSLMDEDSTHELKVLSDDKESKIFDRFMTLVQKVDQFKSVAVHADSLRPGVAEYVDPNKRKAAVVDKDDNVFEQLQAKRDERNRRRKEDANG